MSNDVFSAAEAEFLSFATTFNAVTEGKASGGIFTKAGSTSTINAVKANGTTLQGSDTRTALSSDNAVGRSAVTAAAAGAPSGTAESGMITGAITIAKEDVFAVSGATITPTRS